MHGLLATAGNFSMDLLNRRPPAPHRDHLPVPREALLRGHLPAPRGVMEVQ